MRTVIALSCLALSLAVQAQTVDARVNSFRLNLHGLKGASPSATIQAIVGVINADVQQVRHTTTHVYAQCTGVPSYPIGPWAANPNVPANALRWYRLPRVPVQATVPAATGLGSIGVLVNGVTVFNAKDAFSYNNQGVWFRNAVIVEGPSFDSALGHPAPMGQYHNHQRAAALALQLNDNGDHHSPILGFAFDGYPIYGPHAYGNLTGTAAVRRMVSSYRLRNITTRTTLPNGTVLLPMQYGPPVSTTYPLGTFLEDFEYVLGLGDLDAFNGRFAVTPEFPAGTFAYYMTVDANGNNAYPYIVGPNYRGVLDTANLGTGTAATPPVNALTWNPTVVATGVGCLGPGGSNVALVANSAATVGNTGFGLNLMNGPAGGSGYVFLGTALGRLPATLGGNCQLFLELNNMIGFVAAGVSPIGPIPLDASGSATLPVPIANNPSLVNMLVDVQALFESTGYIGTSGAVTLRIL
ncbi:MAG: YHYH protein [Planctomycetes bacterium]|nr:YHYH protein [Planctomycetota bacterium]